MCVQRVEGLRLSWKFAGLFTSWTSKFWEGMEEGQLQSTNVRSCFEWYRCQPSVSLTDLGVYVLAWRSIVGELALPILVSSV